MNRIVNLIVLFVSLIGMQVYSQGVEFKVSAPRQVDLGERFRLTYKINADVEVFTAPKLVGFKVLSGPNRGQNSSIQIINGKVNQSVSISYTYVLVATQEGEITIPTAKIVVDGKPYQSGKRKIVVGAPNRQTPSNNSNSASQDKEKLQSTDVYIKAFLSKKNVFIGEKTIVTYRIYTKVPVSNLSVDKLSSFGGFWSVDLLDDNKKLNQREEIINGEQYIVADLKMAALYPQKTGDLVIEPMSLTCLAQVQTSRKRTSSNDPLFDSFFNDPFFSNSYRNIEKQLKSKALTIHVKGFPTKGKPADFAGAVGLFTLGSNIDQKKLKANEAITLKYTISGEGNIDLLPDLKVNFPPDFEVYDPKITTRTRKGSRSVSGYKTFEYTAIPRSAGEYKIPAVSFSYFDPKTKSYKTLTSDEYTLSVSKSGQSTQNISYGGSTKEDVRYLGKDIRYISLMPFSLEPLDHFFFSSSTFYIYLLLPLILLLIIVLVWRKEHAKRKNVSLMKNKNATKVAKKRLKKAKSFLKTKDEAAFYNEMGSTLWGYVSDRFSIPLAGLSIDTVSEKLLNKQVSQIIVKALIDTLNDCEFARFAPGDKTSTMEKVYQQGINVISKIEDQIK